MRRMPNTHWIWLPENREKVQDQATLVRFRKNIHLEQLSGPCTLRISADTRYKLYINGNFVQFGPGRGDQRVWYVDSVDIAPWLKPGVNSLAVEVLRYPLAYRSGNFGMVRTATPGLFLEGTGDFAWLFADESWKCRQATQFRVVREYPGFAPLMFLEDYTAEGWEQGWKEAGYDDSAWQNARPYNVMEINEGSCPGDLTPRAIPHARLQKRRLESVIPRFDRETTARWSELIQGRGTVTVPAGEKAYVELNAGELMCGYLYLRLAGGRGAQVKLLTSESYYQKETHPGQGLHVKTDRCDWINGKLDGFTDTYRCAGTGTQESPEIYEPYWFRTFRFIGIEIQAGEEDCTVTGFDYQETGYPLEVISQAGASDPGFAGIWDISLRSLKRCMHETYVDCPFYEQLQYAMDSRNEILYTYMVSGDDRLARQCMDDFRRSQRADGMINCCYPHWGPNIIPGFSIYYILMVYDHMMYFGDKKLVKTHLGAIDGVLEYFDNHLESRGLVGKTGGHISERYWSFIDWAIPWGETVGTPPSGLHGPIVMESFLYIYGLQHAARLCDWVGRQDTASEYRRRAECVQKAINAHCRDEQGFYLDSPGVRDYSQHCQVFAILTDTVPLEEGKRLLLATLEDQEKFAQCTVASLFYVFRALEKAGAYDRTEGLWNPWRKMLRNNLTTCVENDLDGRSDCHAWGSLLLYELPAVILGVQPGSPGYETLKIAPNPGYLSWAEGDVTTPRGTVHIRWQRREDGKLDLDCRIPEAWEGKVELPV